EPLLEISTDKVDAEIPAPAAGVLAEIAVEEGATVEVGSVLAYIETEKGAAPAAAPPEAAAPAPEAKAPEAPREAAPAEARAPAPAPPAAPARGAPAGAPAGVMSADQLWDLFYGQVRHPEWPVRENDRVEPMDRIRRLTAEHMVLAKRIAPHVHSFIEVDFTRIDRIRRKNKQRWEEQGVKVSYTALVAVAVARVLKEFPRVNATISGDDIIYRGDINIGIAVDLNPGLIVPVVHKADELNLLGIAKRINDLAARA